MYLGSVYLQRQFWHNFSFLHISWLQITKSWHIRPGCRFFRLAELLLNHSGLKMEKNSARIEGLTTYKAKINVFWNFSNRVALEETLRIPKFAFIFWIFSPLCTHFFFITTIWGLPMHSIPFILNIFLK